MTVITAFSEKLLEKWPARIFLCLAVLVSYANVWHNVFTFDDIVLIVWNEFLKHWSTLPNLLTGLTTAGIGVPYRGFYRPIQMGLYFFIYQAFGLNEVAFYVLNVALHALNACLLHHFGIKAGFKKGAVFAAVLLWAVHPLHTTNVACISSTGELLWSAFCLLGLIRLLPDFAPRRIWQAMIFFILALGCKESAVVFPALAAVTLFLVSKDRAPVSAYLKMWPLWLLSVVYIAAWLWFIHKTGYSLDDSGDMVFYRNYRANFINRLLTGFATLSVYARLIVWPTGLHISRDFPVFSTLLTWPSAAGALITGLALLQIIGGRARRGLALSFGFLWFAIALSTYTGILFPLEAIISEGWVYVPTMGLFLGVAQTASGFFEKRKKSAWLIVAVLALLLSVTTFFQNKVWRNPETLYQNIVQNGGRVELFDERLAMFYMEQGEFDKAVNVYQNIIDHSGGKTFLSEVHFKLALAWLQVRVDEKTGTFTPDAVVRALPTSRHLPDAIRELGQVLQVNPNFVPGHAIIAAIYHYQGDDQMANFHLKRVEEILQKQGNSGR